MVSERCGMIEAAGDGNFNISSLITTDKYGLVDFEDDFERYFLSNLKQCIWNYLVEFYKVEDFDFDKYIMYVRVNNLWKNICSKSSKRIIKELDEDYGNNMDYIEQRNREEIRSLMFLCIKNSIGELYKLSLQPYINYLDDVKKEFGRTVEINNECRKGNFDVLHVSIDEENDRDDNCIENKDEGDEDLISMLIAPKYQDGVRSFFKGLSEIIKDLSDEMTASDLEDRVRKLSKKIQKFGDIINSYMDLSNEKAIKCIDSYALEMADKCYKYILKKAHSLPFNKDVYLQLINSIKKMSYLMPGTVSFVVSEVNRAALEEEVILSDMIGDTSSEFQIPSSNNDAVRSLTYVNNYGRRIYFE